MADVIHRTTLRFLPSVNEPDYPEPTWKWNPDMTAVAGVPQIYWKAPADWDVVNAGPVEMTQPEKDAVDAAILTAARDGTAGALDFAEGFERAFALVVLDEINTLRAEHALAARTITQLKTALRNKLGT